MQNTSRIEDQEEASRIRLRGLGTQAHAGTRMHNVNTGAPHPEANGSAHVNEYGSFAYNPVIQGVIDQGDLDPARSTGTGPDASGLGGGGGTATSNSAGSLAATAETKSLNRKRVKPSGVQNTGSAAKRRAPGILTTALGWARSQAAELAAFQQNKELEGPDKPLPPLPVPTRRMAAAQHDLLKAQRGTQQATRSTRSTGSAPTGSRPQTALTPRAGSASRHAPAPSASPAAVRDRRPLSAPGDPNHPVAVAFVSGTDPELSSLVGLELNRLNEIALADPDNYAALAEQCRNWAAGETATVAGLTTQDLTWAQNQLKASMKSFSRPGAEPSGSQGGTSGAQGRLLHPPDPRTSSYFIQPSSGQVQVLPQYGSPQYQQYQYQYPRQAGEGSSLGPGGGSRPERYPRRSSRGRNVKRDELYLTLDSEDDEEGQERGDEDGEEESGWGGPGSKPNDPGNKRGPGRPRKQPQDNDHLNQNIAAHMQQQGALPESQRTARIPAQLGRTSPTTSPPLGPIGPMLHPPIGDVLSPFAQFLFEQQSHEKNAPAGTAGAPGDPAAPAVGDGVDYAALDDFIAGLNFANDALMNSPSALTMLHVGGTKPLTPPGPPLHAGLTAQHPAVGLALPPPGMVPTHVLAVPQGVTIAIAREVSDFADIEAADIVEAIDGATIGLEVGAMAAAAAGAPPGCVKVHNAAAVANTEHATGDNHLPGGHIGTGGAVHAALPVLDVPICKPLETPTLAGMLSFGLARKSPTPATSPGFNTLLSPSILNLNF